MVLPQNNTVTVTTISTGMCVSVTEREIVYAHALYFRRWSHFVTDEFWGMGQTDTHIHRLQEVLVCELLPQWVVGGQRDGELFSLQGTL